MAFDRPLEADRVDELSLLSSFVRAPIVGPIMWMLGGHIAKTAEKKLNADTISSEVEGGQQSSSFIDDTERSSPVPSGERSDISEEGDFSSDENDESNVNSLTEVAASFRKDRKMSWSDESGQNLVEYCDEVSDLIGKRLRLFAPCLVIASSSCIHRHYSCDP